LAESGIISYNLYGNPSEGATDFLWMLILSIFYHIGFDTYLSATFLSALSLFGTAFILFKITDSDNIRVFLFILVMLLGMPPIFSAVQGFSTLFFGFFILLSIFFYLKGKLAPLVISSLLTCLIRPDGIVFVAPLIAFFLVLDKENIFKNISYVVFLAIIPGLVYFFWRFQYFNNLFPLPFYVKSNFERFAILFNEAALKTNLKLIVKLIPVMFIVFLGINKLNANKNKIYFLLVSTVFIPFLFYSAMNLEQNVAGRFQYPMAISIIAISLIFYNLFQVIWIYVALLCSLMLMAPSYINATLDTISIPYENPIYISKSLNRLQCNGTMMITEAGRLPYYSKWQAIDLWGLNTPALSKTLVSPQFVRDYNPDLIVLHSGEYSRFINQDNLITDGSKTWINMVKNAYVGAATYGDYQLFMVPFFQTEKCWVCQLKKRLKELVNRNTEFDRYDMYMIRKDSLCFSGVKKIILEHGAVDYQTYFDRKSHFINR